MNFNTGDRIKHRLDHMTDVRGVLGTITGYDPNTNRILIMWDDGYESGEFSRHISHAIEDKDAIDGVSGDQNERFGEYDRL